MRVGVREGVIVPVEVGVNDSLGVEVAVEVCVRVAEGTAVAVGSGVRVGDAVGEGGGGKTWLRIALPNRAEATAMERNSSENASHCQPASM